MEGLPSQFFEINLTALELEMSCDVVEELLGDRGSKVSVSLELKDKDMGSGYGAFVTVSLSCNADTSSLNVAAEVATNLAKTYVEDAFHVARTLYLGTDRSG